jgi:hypothetical protein
MRTSASFASQLRFASAVTCLSAALAPRAEAQFCDPPSAFACPGGGTPSCTEGTLATTVGGDRFGCPLGSQSATWNSEGPTPNAPRLRVPKFKPGPGVCANLERMDIRLQAVGQAHVQLENTDDKPRSFQATVTLNVFVSPEGIVGWPGPIPQSLPITDTRTVNLTAYDQPQGSPPDFQGTSATSYTVGPTAVSECFAITDPALLLQFFDLTPTTTDDFVEFSHSAFDVFVQNGGAQVASIVDTDALLRVDVTYTSCQCQTIANDDIGRVCQGATVTIPVLANDSTTCGALVPPPVFDAPPPSGFSIVGQDVVFDSAGLPTGVYVATYRICNDQAPAPCCDTATVTVTVCATTAVDDAARVCAGSSVTIPVLANDSTTCGSLVPGSLAFVGTPPAGFSIVGGQIVYANGGTPSSGTVSATYQVCNNLGVPCCDTAVVTVTICNVNAADDSARVCAGSSVTVDVCANDTTNCGDLVPGTLAFVGTPPPGFSIGGNCQITYANSGTPGSGTVSATYRICNDESPACCDTAVLTVTI